MTRDEAWMQMAIAEAARARDRDEVPVGAVLVLGERVLAAAGNSCILDHDPCAHAEIKVLRGAGATLGNYRLSGTTLYVTLEPCLMCAGALVNARVDRVVYGCADPDAGAAGSVANLLQTPFLNHRCEVLAGICEVQCREMLQAFFLERRSRRGRS
jgi:tRNA(adenine34) deaminase